MQTLIQKDKLAKCIYVFNPNIRATYLDLNILPLADVKTTIWKTIIQKKSF